jgi:hypothetical protein
MGMSKPSIIPNWKYQKPTKGGYQGLKKLLKNVSHRESPDHRPLETELRWTDCGLGAGWKQVYQNAGQLAGPYVLAHHMVISPAPDLMLLVPEDIRQELVGEVTERTIETWHIERGVAVPEYSYVLHDRDTKDEHSLQQLHTHVFIAGTIDNGLGERQSHRVNREQVVADERSMSRNDNLHRIACQEMEQILDRSIGLEWRQYRELEPMQDAIGHDLTPSVGRDLEIDL